MARKIKRKEMNPDIGDDNIGAKKYAIGDTPNIEIKIGNRVWFPLSDYDETIGSGLVHEIYHFPDSGIGILIWEDKFGSWRTIPVKKVSLKKLRKKRKKKVDIEEEFQGL